ncbi:hypothetical protein [Echinicola pacifica]|uniref:hypothetical protein n=1 Tax=Echinicola pacifica TaxID=346377 RepID=UPI00036A8AEF|nr:hypothetical protein [Echinicola pacifica]
MVIRPEYFEYKGFQVPRGQTFDEVFALLRTGEGDGSAPNSCEAQFPCSAIIVIPSLSFTIRAPQPDRPIKQLQYSLAPLKSTMAQEIYSPYLELLERTMGEPDSGKYFPERMEKTYHSSLVVYSAKWTLGGISIQP